MWHGHKRIPEGVYMHISADCVYAVDTKNDKRFPSFMDENSSYISFFLSSSPILYFQRLKHVLEASQDL